MKKFLTIFMALVLGMFASIFVKPSSQQASASNQNIEIISKTDFETDVNKVLTEYSAFKKRVAGSAGEKAAAEYIINYLNTNTTLIPQNFKSIKNGIQTFKFDSLFEGGHRTSQNIVYYYQSPSSSGKKVILGAHYDAVAFDTDVASETYGQIVESESIAGSAGNVALLLTLAKSITNIDLPFDVEFVFFGAGESNRAGSDYYTDGLTEIEKNNILCMFDLNDVALGNHTYFYVDEISTDLSKLLSEVSTTAETGVQQINLIHLNKSTIANDRLGLGYSHIALDSDNSCFMQDNILAVRLFAGDYSSGIVIGRNEVEGYDPINYTANDSLDYIYKNYRQGIIVDNLYSAYKMVYYSLTDLDFMSICEYGKNASWIYSVFADDNLVLYLTAVALVLFVIIGMYIYYKLSIKAYHANVELEFLSTVVKLSEQVDKTGKDENVPKMISQVIASDIKKDKTIKGKKSKKD